MRPKQLKEKLSKPVSVWNTRFIIFKISIIFTEWVSDAELILVSGGSGLWTTSAGSVLLSVVDWTSVLLGSSSWWWTSREETNPVTSVSQKRWLVWSWSTWPTDDNERKVGVVVFLFYFIAIQRCGQGTICQHQRVARFSLLFRNSVFGSSVVDRGDMPPARLTSSNCKTLSLPEHITVILWFSNTNYPEYTGA